VKVEFFKYHGNGNDFILIDNRRGRVSHLSQKAIAALCDRRFGIGADGLILLNKSRKYDFEMEYYNSDGRESTMCGNGGRCMIRFAKELGMIKDKADFLAVDGPHEGIIGENGRVMLKMNDVATIKKMGAEYVINTGSPHLVKFVKSVNQINVSGEGRKIRNRAAFAKEGVNVNFVEITKGKLKVRTYERGVEDETLSCGTGVVAAALVSSIKLGKANGKQRIIVETPGGKLEVTFVKESLQSFSDIWLIGGAEFVYRGEIPIEGISFSKVPAHGAAER